MKKYKLLLGSMLLCVCMLLCGCGETTSSGEVKAKDYVGKWSTENAYIYTTRQDDSYIFSVSYFGDDSSNFDVWSYTCTYNEENKTMDCSGIKADVSCGDDGNCTTSNNVSDQKAIFAIQDGILIWNEEGSNFGKDMKFTKIEETESTEDSTDEVIVEQ